MTNTLTMDTLYKKLNNFGIPKKYIKKNGLPSWWDDELNDKPVAVLECSAYIAKRFGLDLKSLLSEDEIVKFKVQAQPKFRQTQHQINKQPAIACGLANRIAEMVAYGSEITYTSLPTNPLDIRKEILQHHSIVDLSSLLEYCWEIGIPVVYFNDYPKNASKFQGMIQWHHQKPVITISYKSQQKARLAFILAHELGHLALSHVKDNSYIDYQIKFNSPEKEEEEANQFAVSLLLGEANNCLENKLIYNSYDLIEEANKIIKENSHLDIGCIILNHAWHKKKWGMANKALNEIFPDEDAGKLINQFLANRLNWDVFDDDSYEYLAEKTGYILYPYPN